ncbi:MAG: hypothetical protein JXM74_00035 [Fusobacteriaceae bacterium]|nr:hypothetical protein [Fusobacteriaceae bacterium]
MKINETKLLIMYREFKDRAHKELSEIRKEEFFDFLIENYEVIVKNPSLIEKKFNELKVFP